MGSRSYTLEFKRQAVKLAESLGSVMKAAKQLGIPDVNIHSWRKKLRESEGASSKLTVSTSLESEEIKKLRRENEELKQVNLILKTAAAFFSQDHLKKNIS
jgi:transposase